MIEFLLDGRQVTSRDTLHNFFAEGLDFPDYYGKNLDALFDCLGEINTETRICILHWRTLEENLEDYARRLMSLLWRAVKENPRLHLCICSGI